MTTIQTATASTATTAQVPTLLNLDDLGASEASTLMDGHRPPLAKYNVQDDTAQTERAFTAAETASSCAEGEKVLRSMRTKKSFTGKLFLQNPT